MITRMHSSRMLTVCCSGAGESAGGGGFGQKGVCLPKVGVFYGTFMIDK